MNIIVLASGRGSRLNRITKNKPKCLIKIKNEKTILEFISENFTKKDNSIISIGYKSHLIKKILKRRNIKFIQNKNYKKTNMVESLMLCEKKLVNSDLIIVYGDIFFDKLIIEKIRKIKGNVVPINANWLRSWKKRYKTLDKIKKDAENLIVSKSKIKSIGEKIGKKIPSFQYMGILKVDIKTFFELKEFYNSLNNKKISLTEFINESIKSKIAEYKYFISKYYWYEVDNYHDLKYLKKTLKKYN